MRIILKILTPILLTTFFIYLPYFANKELYLGRHNDLIEFFWPIIFYIKESILVHHQLPFWNSLFFMGTPLVSDPQNLFWYLPNSIFLFLPIDSGLLTTFILHTIFGGLGMYFACRAFKFSTSGSVFAACLYIASPKLTGYIEAGHLGLVLSFAWFPWIIVSIKKLVDKPNFSWSFLLALSVSSIYFNHILTALIAGLIAIGFAGYLFSQKPTKQTILYGGTAAVLFLLIIAPVFYVQNAWFSQTTRDLLLANPDVYPKWLSKLEFVKNIFILTTYDTEKIIILGIVSSLLAIVGTFKIARKNVGLFILVVIAVSIISLNNASPFYTFFLKQNWYVMLRVATRAWFIVILICTFLAVRGFEYIYIKKKIVSYVFGLLAIGELLFWSYAILSKPIITSESAPLGVYEFLQNDQDYFRVFCTTRCLSQKESAIHHLKLADGYGTLQQKNYYEAAKQIGQYYSKDYSLSIPPFDIYLYQKLQPHGPTLASYGIKYVVSPHLLTDKNLKPIRKFDQYTVYENLLYKKLIYSLSTANYIQVKNPGTTNNLTIPEIYNSNWHAYDDNGNNLSIHETPDHTILVTTNGTKYVNLKYQPYYPIFKK